MKRNNPFPNFGSLLKDHFFAGMLVLVPFAVAAWILEEAVRALWRLQELLPDAWRPAYWLSDPNLVWLVDVAFALGLALVVALAISLLGWISKRYLGRKILEFIAAGIIQRIPVVRSIYSALDQLLRTMAQGGGQQFNRVVYVEYPRKGVWALAFVTGPVRQRGIPAGHLNVYVPTTPNPTSGFHLIVAESEVKDSQMSVEEAFKTLLSLGIAQPGARHGG